MALFEDGEVRAEREWLFGPPRDRAGRICREYDVCALEVSGKRWTQLKRDGAAPETVCRELQEWAEEHGCGDSLVVAFNAAFDLAFYSELLFLAGSFGRRDRLFRPFRPPLYGPWQCARQLAQVKAPDLVRHDLETVAGHFGLKREAGPHSALGDAVLAGRVFGELVR